MTSLAPRDCPFRQVPLRGRSRAKEEHLGTAPARAPLAQRNLPVASVVDLISPGQGTATPPGPKPRTRLERISGPLARPPWLWPCALRRCHQSARAAARALRPPKFAAYAPALTARAPFGSRNASRLALASGFASLAGGEDSNDTEQAYDLLTALPLDLRARLDSRSVSNRI